MVLVMVVPILAPIIIGMALSKAIEPEATSATTIAVVVELLWIIAVISSPMKRPVKGLDVARIMVSAADLPRCCKEAIIRSSANTNSTNVPMIYSTLVNPLQFEEGCSIETGCSTFLINIQEANHTRTG